jgi:hypothetical protein
MTGNQRQTYVHIRNRFGQEYKNQKINFFPHIAGLVEYAPRKGNSCRRTIS